MDAAGVADAAAAAAAAVRLRRGETLTAPSRRRADVEYRTAPSGSWHASLMGQETVEHLLSTQFAKYLKDVELAAKVRARANARRGS